ncbi:enoyl-ACP reductase FabI [Conexibacter sp. W3-3-2]|uniref:enoyl-ACP reductase FabI n=1 Tax=Conexibacter sp. W3-3-2 TaxID=2675227 RepID=UPI0012B72A45|nr:enoyl-ACP reductase FabI [Conexibacter sp. W3-3-2]MTD44255.1 enoyl-ACP reductase FabI [Conexibacter sp. W3-3-2]
MAGLLEGRRLLVTGVVTKSSIAFHVARRAQEEGAEVLLTGFGRTRRMTERAAGRLPQPAEVVELDVTNADDLAAIGPIVADRFGHLDGLLHGIAFAPGDAIGGNFLDAPVGSTLTAFHISAVSLRDLVVALRPQLAAAPEGGAVVGLDFDGTVAWPHYDWMGVAKAGLEAVTRYLARDLGEERIRVNLVASGPIETLAASGIDGFDRLATTWEQAAPLGWDVTDPEPVADASLFLLSPLSRVVSGHVLHADGGAHAVRGASAAVPAEVALPA